MEESGSHAGPGIVSQTASVSPWTRILPVNAWLRILYLCNYAANGSIQPYLTLHYRELGYSGLEVGLLAATIPLGSALFAPLCGLVADRFMVHRAMLRGALAVAASGALLMSQATSFYPSFMLVLLVSLSSAPLVSLIDSYGLAIGEQEGVSYGRFRVWGSFGYTAASWLIGQRMGSGVSSLFLIAYAISLVFAFGATLGLPSLGLHTALYSGRGFAAILSNSPLLVLLLTTFLVSVATGIMYNYLAVYLAALGAGAHLVGLAFSVASMSQWPVMIFSAWFFRRLSSRKILMLAIGIYAIRFALYSIVHTPVWVLPVQLLHGLSYGLYLMASVTWAYRLANRELAATALGLLASMSSGFGMMAGALLGGALFDRTEGPAMFYLGTLLMLAALALFVVGSRRSASSKHRH
jgi:PPP family 3-phenylpropionic acid transporter